MTNKPTRGIDLDVLNALRATTQRLVEKLREEGREVPEAEMLIIELYNRHDLDLSKIPVDPEELRSAAAIMARRLKHDPSKVLMRLYWNLGARKIAFDDGPTALPNSDVEDTHVDKPIAA